MVAHCPAPESNAGVERQRRGPLLLLANPEIRTLKHLKGEKQRGSFRFQNTAE